MCCGMLLAACGGGGSSPVPPALPVQDAPFALSSSTISDNASNVARDAVIGFNFSNTLNPASVDGKSVTVTGPLGNSIPFALNVTGADLKIGGGLGLPGNTKYRIDLTTAIRNSKGSALPDAYSRTFTTAPQVWQPNPTSVGAWSYFTGGSRPVVQADSMGNLTVVWSYTGGVGANTFFAARLDKNTGVWGAAQPLYHSEKGEFGAVSMIAGPKGTLYFTWTEFTPGAPQVARMARYAPATGWSAPADLPVAPPNSGPNVRLAADAAGNLMVLAGTGVVYATRYDAATETWGKPQRIDSPEGSENYLLGISIAADGKGNFVAAWGQDFVDGRKAVVARYSNSAWSKPKSMEGYLYGGGLNPVFLSVNMEGRASVVWTVRNGSAPNALWGSRYAPDTDSWTASARIDQAPGNAGADNGSAVIDGAGNITATWSQGIEGVYARRFSAASGAWSVPQRLNDTAFWVQESVAVVDSAGNVTIAFVQDQVMKASQYVVGDAQWHLSTIGLRADARYEVSNLPAVTLDEGGTVGVAWYAMEIVGNQQNTSVVVNRFR